MSITAELVVDAKAELGEGPLWDPSQQRLYWVDILQKHLHIYDPVSNTDRIVIVEQMPGTVVVRKRGGLMLAVEGGFAEFDSESGNFSIIHDPESDIPGNRFNDGKCDPAGRFWAGTMEFHGKPECGNLYRLNTDLTVHKVLENVSISNGIVWSADAKTMYFIDSLTRRVDAFDYDNASGDISNRRTACSLAPGKDMPDGMAIDVDDCLWVAHFYGNCVSHWDPRTGKQIGEISVPAGQVTACAFGGANLDELYITTAREDKEALGEDEPVAGGLFKAIPGVIGAPTFEFSG